LKVETSFFVVSKKIGNTFNHQVLEVTGKEKAKKMGRNG